MDQSVYGAPINNTGLEAGSIEEPERVIGAYNFKLLMRNPVKVNSNQIVVIESTNLAVADAKPVKFAVYRSHSQIQWRFAIVFFGSRLEKFSDYTCTTQIHPMLQEFIESEFDNIKVVDDTRVLSIRDFGGMYYLDIINAGRVNNVGTDLQKISDAFDTKRVELDPNFYLVSSGLFNLGTSSHEQIERTIDNARELYGQEKFAELQKELDMYLPKTKDGMYESLNLEKKLDIIESYLKTKLEIIPNTAQLEYYIDPANLVLSVENYEENMDRQATRDEVVNPYSGELSHFHEFGTPLKSKRYLAIQAKAGNKFNYNNMIKHINNKPYVSRTITIFDKSPAVLSVALRSKTNYYDTYRLYYFDYQYRGKRYMIPLNILIDGININEFGMPIKYIPLGIYAGKILEYLHQTDITAKKYYDLMYVNHKIIYVFIGDMYTNIWPMKQVSKLKHLALVSQKYGPQRNPMMENTMFGFGIPPTHHKRTFLVLGNTNIRNTAKNLAKSRPQTMKVRRVPALGGTQKRIVKQRIVNPNNIPESEILNNSGSEYSANEN